MNAKKIVEALTSNAKCTYEFDVTTGLLENDIIGSDGINYTKKALKIWKGAYYAGFCRIVP